MDREAWRATVHGVINGWTSLSTHVPSVKSQKTLDERHLVCTTYKQLPRFVMCWPSTRIALLQRHDVPRVWMTSPREVKILQSNSVQELICSEILLLVIIIIS